METSPSAEMALGTVILVSSESTMPPELGKLTVANCCVLAVVITTTAAPRPVTAPACAWTRPGTSAKPQATAIRTKSADRRTRRN